MIDFDYLTLLFFADNCGNKTKMQGDANKCINREILEDSFILVCIYVKLMLYIECVELYNSTC